MPVKGDIVLQTGSEGSANNGTFVLIDQTVLSSGTLLHTATTDDWDFVTVWAMCLDTTTRILQLGWGGTAAKDTITVALYPNTPPVEIIIKKRIKGGLLIKAAADVANKVSVALDVDRFYI